MKTSLGVSYKGGHWFHVAETFLTQHVRPLLSKASSSAVLFHFDRPNFVHELNGFTRLLILLGLYVPNDIVAAPSSVHFLHIEEGAIAWHLLRPGDGFRIPHNLVKERQVKKKALFSC